MSVIIWNQGANAQLEQGLHVFNWLSGGNAVEVVDFATAEWTLNDGPAHYAFADEPAHFTFTDSPAHWEVT